MKSTIKRSLLILSIVCILLSVLAVPALAEDTVIYAAPSAAGTADGSSWANAMTLDAAWAAATSGTKISLSPVHITARLL